ncbi:UDP-N-acetyl-D-mannosamine dehydrogenase [Corynebacterium qintianiae]|uniref:UDP-N-acetyl-D-mannosamine dehydrogenase n=1 Tax=Corynebacterium qintianiae TaxID=2709392 RepID=UPI0013EA1BBA|nr:UDP-N-acetyl-D-mannosamine dehydrogenase [Corynebacterium qintianiae]
MDDSSRVDVCVAGLGYVGLPTAVFFADRGLEVVGVDVDPHRVGDVNAGVLPFVEPGLGDLLRGVVQAGKLTARMDMPAAATYIIAVPTPILADRSVDSSFVWEAASNIAHRLHGDELIILESTVPPLTTEGLRDRILELRPDLAEETDKSPGLGFAHCPERVLPGSIMIEMTTTDRVIGGVEPRATERAVELYSSISSGHLHKTDAKTAELTKLTENSYRDVNIAFANELSLVCKTMGVDVWELIELANHHPRVNILQPGPGVGGHCIAVDPWFIVQADPDNTRLIQAARRVNDLKPMAVVKEVLKSCEGIEKPKIEVLGITFKPNVDDVRQSPAVVITRELAQRMPEAEIEVIDPLVHGLPEDLGDVSNIGLVSDIKEAKGADVLVVLVDHDEFHLEDLEELQVGAVVDTRGLFRKEVKN